MNAPQIEYRVAKTKAGYCQYLKAMAMCDDLSYDNLSINFSGEGLFSDSATKLGIDSYWLISYTRPSSMTGGHTTLRPSGAAQTAELT